MLRNERSVDGKNVVRTGTLLPFTNFIPVFLSPLHKLCRLLQSAPHLARKRSRSHPDEPAYHGQ